MGFRESQKVVWCIKVVAKTNHFFHMLLSIISLHFGYISEQHTFQNTAFSSSTKNLSICCNALLTLTFRFCYCFLLTTVGHFHAWSELLLVQKITRLAFKAQFFLIMLTNREEGQWQKSKTKKASSSKSKKQILQAWIKEFAFTLVPIRNFPKNIQNVKVICTCNIKLFSHMQFMDLLLIFSLPWNVTFEGNLGFAEALVCMFSLI